jgi:hypothetical protein
MKNGPFMSLKMFFTSVVAIVLICTASAAAQSSKSTRTVVFQNGLNGYSGTVDTYIWSASDQVDKSFGTEKYIKWDRFIIQEGLQTEEKDALIRFDDIFGSGTNQVPVGAPIVSATLSYIVSKAGSEADVYNILVNWFDSNTWSTFGPIAGIQEDVDYASSHLVATTTGSNSGGLKEVNVTASLSAWSENPAANHGWLFRPKDIKDIEIRSSESTIPSYRPELTVVYTVDAVKGVNAPNAPNAPPDQPVLIAPADNEIDVSLPPDLQVSVSDPNSKNLTIKFYGRRKPSNESEDFTIVVLPDPQKYTSGRDGGTLEMFTSQTRWCVDQRYAHNIAYVANVGDVTDNNYASEWDKGNTAMSILESPDPGFPYGIALGNHDFSEDHTTLFNNYFPFTRYEGRSYYGGHYDNNNNNHYSFFSAGGMDFIVIDLGFGSETPTQAVLDWANTIMSNNPDKRAIVVTHHLLSGLAGPDGSWSGPGQAIYDALKANPNLFLMLCGHEPYEDLRWDIFNGNKIYTILSDYQSWYYGGNGWLRILTFSPANNKFTVSSYSPYTHESNWNGSPPYDLSYSMCPYKLIGTNSGVTSGSETAISWPGLDCGQAYEWYTTVYNGTDSITGPVWTFTTTNSIIWTGNTDHLWNKTSNWSTSTIPGATDNVIIANTENDPLITGSTACNNLAIDPSASLTVNPGGSLTVKGDLTVEGTFTIESSGVSSSGSLIVEGSSTGNVTYNRTMPAGGTFHYISSPVGLTNLPAAGTFKKYDEPTGEWQATTVNATGKGYTLQTDGGSAQFTGTVVKSASVIGSSPYLTGGDRIDWEDYGQDNPGIFVAGRSWDDYGGGGWNLLGNPFTSAMDAVKFINENVSSFDPNYKAVYIYNGSNYSYIGSQTTGWEETKTGFSFDHIQAGQGFFVLAYYNGVTFDFDQTMQVHNTAVPMTKSAGGQDPWPGIRLIARRDSTEASSIVVYNDNMTVGVDPGYDIGLLNSGSDIEIYTTIEDNCNSFARQALPITGYEKNVITVGINCEKGGNINFSAFVVPLEDSRFYLEDRQLGLFIDLNAREYNVTIPARTYGTGRFYLHTTRTTGDNIKPKPEDTDLANLQVWPLEGRLIISGTVSDKAMCEVYDLTGRKIVDVRLTDGERNTVDMPAGSYGYFIVRIIEGSKLTTRKVVFP